MMNRPRMTRGPRPVSHNQQQSRVGPGGAGMPGMGAQRVNAVPAGPRTQKYRPAVNQPTAAQQTSANATASASGIAIPVSKMVSLCKVSR